jgi:hypothetical protein
MFLLLFAWLVFGDAHAVPAGLISKPNCEVLLEVFDDGVSPPFAHGLALINLLEGNPIHRIAERKGNAFNIETLDPNKLLQLVSERRIAIDRAWLDGRLISLYRSRPATKSESVDAANLHLIMSLLPEGRYLLKTEDAQNEATMFVEFHLEPKPLLRAISVSIKIFPGHIFVPPWESKFRQLTLGTFSSKSVDAFSVRQDGQRLKISYLLPYGYGDDDLEFELADGVLFNTVRTKVGQIFKLDSFYPVSLRTMGSSN